MTNKEYAELDAAINAELDAEEASIARAEEEAAAVCSDYSPRNAWGLDRDDIETLKDWGVI